MRYTNPIVKGFYPDPSVCFADGKYYMVCSSFQYFPGVPLFESENLVNWTQLGHVLTRKSQVMLEKIESSGGVLPLPSVIITVVFIWLLPTIPHIRIFTFIRMISMENGRSPFMWIRAASTLPFTLRTEKPFL